MDRISSWTLVRIVRRCIGSGVSASARIAGTIFTAVCAPAGSKIPCSRRIPRSVLIRAVRGRHPLLADAVDRDQRLLLDARYRHARHLARTHGFEDRFGIGPIGLVATDVRAYVGR